MLHKKLLVVTFLILGTLVFGQIFVTAQTKKTNSTYGRPSRLSLRGDEKGGGEESPDKLLLENFYPIGWSEDGKFAYYTEPADEACGCYFGNLIIQDMRTDKILWRKDYTSENGGADNLKDYWQKNQKEFSRKLAEYKITAPKSFTLLDSPFKFQNDVFSVDLTQNLKFEDISAKGSVILQMIYKTGGAKTIYEEKYTPKVYSSLRSAEIGGILPSPFEARVAVVLVETHRGWEGPPNITRLKVIGASLTKGFK